MKKYTASRVSEGNKLFPSQLIIDKDGVTIKNPSLFSGEETTIPYSRISSVNIDCPFIGYSTIIIGTTGESVVTIHGFLKSEVKEMKSLILEKIGSGL